MTLFAIGMPGPMELCIIAGVAVLLFGNKLPKMAHSIGSAIPQFKKGLKDVEDDLNEVEDALKS